MSLQPAQETMSKTVQQIACRRLADGRFTAAEAGVIVEKELRILIDGEHLVTASIIPELEREFVMGYLFGQGFIDSIGELASVEIDDDAARVTLRDPRKRLPRTPRPGYRIVSGGGRMVFLDSVTLPQINSRLTIAKKDVFRAMNTLFEKAALYRATEGVHAAGLFTPAADPICTVEDIGRHNTLDKAIGYALGHGIDPGQTLLAATGRMSSEMVAKICRARIPVAATKTAVTMSGLETGKRCGLTIIGFVRDTGHRINTDMEVRIIEEPGMKVYTHPERITV